ncbi:MAG: hypothetical protein PVF16_07160 [Chromatiales bacterium]
MKRRLEFDTGRGAGKTLGQVLRVYTDAAYPRNGSECSQASRAALIQLAEEIALAGEQSRPVQLKRRQLPTLRTAVEWYFSEVQKEMMPVRDALLARLG